MGKSLTAKEVLCTTHTDHRRFIPAEKKVQHFIPEEQKNSASESLVLMVMNGNDIAFSELQLRYELYIYLYICSNIDSAAEAENLTQDTFIEALEALREKRYTPQQHFSAWMLSIAEHVVHDWKKHKINQPHEQLNEEMEEEMPSPVITYSDPYLQKLLGKALEKLNTTDCSILIMHAVEGKTYKEIGIILNLKKDTVKRRFLRLCERLRKVLKGLKKEKD